MMGTLATLMAGKKIPTPGHLYWADVEGDIENVNNVLKITTIRVKFHLKCLDEQVADARGAFETILASARQPKVSMIASNSKTS